MAFVDLATVKSHLRLPETETADDTLLLLYLDAACAHVREFTRVEWPDAGEIPPAVRVAALMLAADLYENREGQTSAPLAENKTVSRLLWPHRTF